MALNRISSGSNKGSNDDGESNFTRLGDGEYEGRLVYVADLGLQERKFMGDEKPPCQQLSLGIEIVGSDNNGQPRFLWTKPFNIFSKMSDKSKEYEYYTAFNPSAKADTVADWDAVLGEPCSVVVVTTKSKDGTKEYDNIHTVSSIPSKYRKDVAEARITPCIGDCEDESNEATAALYGLAKFVWEKRIIGKPAPSKKSSTAKRQPAAIDITEDVPY